MGLAAELRAAETTYRLATFSADVTVPLGHGMMGGSWLSTRIADPLEAHGLVPLGGSKPVVFAALDSCEVRNEALERWQRVLADAAGTDPERVMVCAVHQHDAPVADLGAEQILRDRGAKGTVCDPGFHEAAVQRTAKALRASLASARPVTGLGMAPRRSNALLPTAVIWRRTARCALTGPAARATPSRATRRKTSSTRGSGP